MACPDALPVGQEVALLLFGPPIMTVCWLLMSRGWAGLVQGGTVSERTKKRQKLEFRIVLTVLYAIGLGVALYAYLACPTT